MNFKGLKFRKLGNINLKTLEDYAPYLAGLFDGEGSFVLRETGKNLPNFSPLIEISMTHEQTIQFVAKEFNVGPVGKYQRKNSKDLYYVRVTTQNEIKQVCEALQHHSITKHEQISLLLDYFSLKTALKTAKRTTSKHREILIKMVDLYINLKKANAGIKHPDYEAMRQDLLKRIPKG